MPDIFCQFIGLEGLEYTKYACAFQTSTRQKNSRHLLLMISSELPCWWGTLKKSSAAAAGAFLPIHRFGRFGVHKVRLRFPNLDPTKNLSPSALADFFRASLLGNSEEIPHAYCPLSGLSLRGPARGRGNLAGSFRIFEDPRRIRNMVPESPTPLRSSE